MLVFMLTASAFFGCGNGAPDETKGSAWPPEYAESDGAAIIVESAKARAGDTVEIAVSIQNNPGVAGAKIFVSFDAELTLIGAESGEAFSVLDYTPPGTLSNRCPFNWDSLDAESDEDGTVLVLTFEVGKGVSAGDELNVSVFFSDGDIFNADLNDVSLDVVNGKITIKGEN